MYRRSFISRFTGAAALFGIGRSGSSNAQPSQAFQRFEPARHALDDWFDQVPGKHRVFFDTTLPAHVPDAVLFTRNYLDASKSAYGLDDRDLALVICLRHRSTPFAFNDAIWAKYDRAMSERIKVMDPKTGEPPATNPYPGLTTLVKGGVQLAICDMATHAYARLISEKTDGDPEAIYKELRSNAVGNGHFVPAGIVAVNRAQERGYSIVHLG